MTINSRRSFLAGALALLPAAVLGQSKKPATDPASVKNSVVKSLLTNAEKLRKIGLTDEADRVELIAGELLIKRILDERENAPSFDEFEREMSPRRNS